MPAAYASKELLRGTVTQDVRQIPKGLRNSFLVATGTVLINLVFATLAAYTFARERFRGGQAAFTFILGSRLLPSVAVAVPIYVALRNLGLLDSKLGLVLIYSAFTLPFSIWVLTLFFRSLPFEIEEAARVDGCTRLQTLRHVVLPLAAPGLGCDRRLQLPLQLQRVPSRSSPPKPRTPRRSRSSSRPSRSTRTRATR